MTHLYLIVDQNFLRTNALRERLRTEPKVRLVLPDLAMFEMAKSKNRELTIRLSLKILAQEPQRVFVSRALSDCLRYELDNKVSVVEHLIDRDATIFLRKVLTSIATELPNSEYNQVISDPQNHLSHMRRDYLNDNANKSSALELVDATKQNMTAEFAKSLRGSRATRSEKIDFIYEKAPMLLVDVLKDNGFSHQEAIQLLCQKPMLLRYFFVKLWACLSWEEQGRIQSLGPAKVSNDLIDHEYILAATFFDGLLTEELAVNEAYSAVKELLVRA